MRPVRNHATLVALGWIAVAAPIGAHAATPSHLTLDARFCSGVSLSATGTAYTLKCDALPCTAEMSAPSVAPGKPIVATLRCSGAIVPSSWQWSVSGDASCPTPGGSIDQKILTATAPATCTYRVIATAPTGDKGSGVFQLTWK